MKLDLGEMFRMIAAEIPSKRSRVESISQIIAYARSKSAHEDWGRLEKLPWGDHSELKKWIMAPFLLEPPAEPLCGLWFGLFNPYEDGKTTADMYVCGSSRVSLDREGSEWGCDPEWLPKTRYAQSQILDEIYQIAYSGSDGLKNDAEYALCLGYTALVVRDLSKELGPKLFLGKSKEVGVAVGFDSGDAMFIGTIRSDGLHFKTQDA